MSYIGNNDATVVYTLGVAVANNGTFAVGYPTGFVQADFTSDNASATAVMVVNGNDVWTEAADNFDISYGASTVTVTQKTGATLAIGAEIILQLARAGSTGDLLQAGAIASLTDNSTGSATDTIAAGAGVHTICIPHTFIGGTSAVEPLTDLVLGYKFKVLKFAFVTEVALVGASGSRVANLEIGSTDVGTSPAVCTIPIANTAVGTVTAAAAVSGANTGSAAATLSIEIASGGTAFSAGSGTFQITVQNMDTADAIASLSAKVDDVLVKLRASGVIET